MKLAEFKVKNNHSNFDNKRYQLSILCLSLLVLCILSGAHNEKGLLTAYCRTKLKLTFRPITIPNKKFHVYKLC